MLVCLSIHLYLYTQVILTTDLNGGSQMHWSKHTQPQNTRQKHIRATLWFTRRTSCSGDWHGSEQTQPACSTQTALSPMPCTCSYAHVSDACQANKDFQPSLTEGYTKGGLACRLAIQTAKESLPSSDHSVLTYTFTMQQYKRGTRTLVGPAVPPETELSVSDKLSVTRIRPRKAARWA